MKHRVAVNGLTLVEMLVALVLTTTLTMLLVPGLMNTVHAWRDSRSDFADAVDVRMLEQFVRTVLEEQIPTAGDGPLGGGAGFQGGPGGFECVTRLPRHLAMPGLYRVRIDSIPDGQVGFSFRQIEVAGPARQQEHDQPIVLLKGRLRGLSVRYFGARAHEPPAWHDDWPRAAPAPSLVEIVADIVGRRPSVLRVAVPSTGIAGAST